MKYLLIGFFTRTYMPYIDKYEKCLKEKGVEYDIVFFDRDNTQKNVIHEGNEFTYCHSTTTSRLKKLLPVYKYISFIKKLIKRNKYDKLIVMTTMPAVLLKPLLIGEYKERYIYDYRDTTYEHFKFFRNAVDKIIDHSYFTAMSSRGYLHVLSENNKIIFNHNISNVDDAVSSVDKLSEKHLVVIGFLGYVRYFDVNSLLINQFKNYADYRLLYAGTPFSDCDLAGYAETVGANNVEVIGKYDNRNKARFYERIDIINSMYSMNSSEVEYAIPNRLYDAALFKKPIMTTKGTYLSGIVEKYNLGFSVDPFNDHIPQRVKEYIENFEPDEFQNACNMFLDHVLSDEALLIKKIMNFIG